MWCLIVPMWWGVRIIVFDWDSYIIPITFNLISLFTLTFWFFCYFDVRYLLWWQSPWYHVECIWGKLYFSTCLRFGLKSDPLFWDREALRRWYKSNEYLLLFLWIFESQQIVNDLSSSLLLKCVIFHCKHDLSVLDYVWLWLWHALLGNGKIW